MTERQGGSDVRANITRAHGRWRRLVRAARPQVVLLLPAVRRLPGARAGPGGSLLLPRRARRRAWSSSGSRTSSARARCRARRSSSTAPRARLLGEEGRGVQTIIRMVNHTRLDCMLGSATVLPARARSRRSIMPDTAARSAPGSSSSRRCSNVLADLALDSEAATVAAMRVARAYDEGDYARDFRRLATAVMKYWICKRAPVHAAEALECLGGNGFVEDSGLPAALPRRADQLDLGGLGQRRRARRAARAGREPEGRAAFLAECELARGADRRLDAHLDRLERLDAAGAASSTRAAWRRNWRSRFRARCWCATRRRRSRTPSVPPGSAGRVAAPTARCRPASTRLRSSIAHIRQPDSCAAHTGNLIPIGT